MALPSDLDVEQALADYDEEYAKKRSNIKVFGRSISDIPCFRDSYLYGILGGFGVGLTTFMLTSRVKRAMDFGVGGFALVTLGYFGYCRYDRATRKWELQQIKGGFQKMVMSEGVTNPELLASITQGVEPNFGGTVILPKPPK